MNAIAKSLYDEIVLLLHKANPKDPGKYQAYVEQKLSGVDDVAKGAILQSLATARERFRDRFTYNDIIGLTKAKRTAFVNKATKYAFAFSPEKGLIAAIAPIIPDVIAYYKTAHLEKSESKSASGAQHVPNKRAIDKLRTSTKNVFSTLSDAMAMEVNQRIADAKEGEHDLNDIVDGIRDTWAADIPTYDAQGMFLRYLDNEVWATMVARTEGTRAAADAQVETLTDLGLEKFEFVAESQACDDCSELDGELFDIGDSENTPPIHPNCRCIVTPVMDELLSATEGDDSEKDSADE